LYSYQAFSYPSSSFVITTSPFFQSGWCQHTLSVKEIACLFDVPVAIEKRLASAHPLQLPLSHALLSSVPTKVLQHSLWLTGHFCVQQQGVEDIFCLNFTIEAKSGLLVAQDKFNLENQERSKNIDILAAKVDNAEVPVDLWNSRILHTSPSSLELISMDSQKFVRIIDWLRTRALCRWKANILKSFKRYLKITWPNDYMLYLEGKRGKLLNSQFIKDLEAGKECLKYAAASSWWEWLEGSRLFFWRWSPEFQRFARDGIPVCWLPGKLLEKKKHVKK
jgi:hypothetical protein